MKIQIGQLAHSMCILLCLCGCSQSQQTSVIGGNVERGRAAIERYGCVACHAIPGVANPRSNVGPPLAQMAKRAYIAGVMANTPDNMVRWLRDPPAIDPRTAMPNLNMSESEAKDIAAYLYTLE